MKMENVEKADLESRRANVLLLSVIALGFLIRLFLLYTTRNTGLMIVDEQHYYQIALNLLHGHGFAWEPGRLTSSRPPLFPGFMVLVWTLTGTESVLMVRIAQIVLAFANAYLIFRLGLMLFGRRVALLAAAGLAFYPSFLAFNMFILTEVLFTFLLTLAVLGVVTLLRTGKAWIAWSTGIVFGLAALTRSVLWPFPAVLSFFLFFVMHGDRQRRLRLIALLLVGYILAVVPWSVRNTRLQGVFTVVDTMGGITLRMGNYEYTPLNRAWDPVTLEGDQSIFQELHAEHPDFSSWTEGRREKWALRKAIAYMLDHPGVTLQRSLIKFANFWGLERTVIAGWQQELYRPPMWLAAIGTVVIPLAYAAVMLLACVGLFLSPPQDRRAHLFLLLVGAFLAGMHSLAFGHERYHLPLVPFLLLYAAAAVAKKSWREVRLQLRWCAGPLAVGASLLVIWAREVLIVETGRIQILLHEIFG